MTIARFITRAALALACLPFAAQADVLEARSTYEVALPSHGSDIAVLVLPLPAAGQYRAVAKVSLSSPGSIEDYARCGVMVDGSLLDSSVTVIGGNAPSVATLVTQARVTTTTPNHTVSVHCSHDNYAYAIVALAGASLELSTAAAGPKGDPGAAGNPGQAGAPGEASFGICVGVNAANPTSAYCSCPGGKTVSQVFSAGTCSVVAQSGSCSASGWVPPGPPGSGTYVAACCACDS
jgi:hypothetical protein